MREHGDLDAGVEQLAGDDEAVAAVVALAGEDHDALGVEGQHDLAGHGRAGALHEVAAGDAEALDRRRVGRAHLLGREQTEQQRLNIVILLRCLVIGALAEPPSRPSPHRGPAASLDGDGHGVGHAAGVAQRQFYPRDAQSSSDLGDVAVQRDPRLAAREHLDLAPDEPDDADSQRLAHRLLGGEAGGVARARVGEAVGSRRAPGREKRRS